MNISIIAGATFITCSNRRDFLKMVFAAKAQSFSAIRYSANYYAVYNVEGNFSFIIQMGN